MHNKDLESRIFRLYDCLKEWCVGKENIKTYDQLAMLYVLKCNQDSEAKGIYLNNHALFKKDIQVIRERFDRIVCSTCKGYYLPISAEEESGYMLSSALRLIRTCLAQGVSKKLFYSELANDCCNSTNDNQGKIQLGDYEKDVIKRYSDDLR